MDVRQVNIENCWMRGSMRARSILLDEGGDSFSENDLDWDRLERTGCDMFKPFGKDFVGINDADDDATNVAHDNPEEAENSFDAGAATREVEGAVVEQSEVFKRQGRKIVGDLGMKSVLTKLAWRSDVVNCTKRLSEIFVCKEKWRLLELELRL